MMANATYKWMLEAHRRGEPLLCVLIDPDKTPRERIEGFVKTADRAGADCYFVGGSLSFMPDFNESLAAIKRATSRPVIIFPGGVHHISRDADAILFLSIVSGRNAEHLIGQHVIAAPVIRKINIEAISTAYMFVESGRVSTAEYISYTKPLPRHKPDLAVAHALAAELLGFKLLYLEAGSGALETVPDDMIAAVAACTDIPLVVGGGIRTPEIAAAKARAGASIVVIGNHFEDEFDENHVRAFADAVHAGALPETNDA
jgi:phosphoglycerol geranylgeranyltransferase